MDREAIEKLAIDLEEKQDRWIRRSLVKTEGMTPDKRAAHTIDLNAAYDAYLSARKRYLDAVC